MSDQDAGYILIEIWKAKDSWLKLAPGARRRFFDQKLAPFLGAMIAEGAEILSCAINDNASAERIDYDYMAVWKLPNKAFSERVESGAKDLGFLLYFDQVNFSGSNIAPQIMNEHMIDLQEP